MIKILVAVLLIGAIGAVVYVWYGARKSPSIIGGEYDRELQKTMEQKND